jgi:hypothetical protein
MGNRLVYALFADMQSRLRDAPDAGCASPGL